MKKTIRNLFMLNDVKNVDLDDAKTTLLHRNIILKKSFLKNIYIDFYNTYKENSKDTPSGHKVEIGSGGGFLKEIIPEVITSDVLKLPTVDMIFSAETMPFRNETVSAFFMLDTLHHIPNPSNFLRECERCLIAGGKVIMIEPANTAFSRLFFKNFHHEAFDETVKEWKLDSKGPLSSANMALPWIIFFRDKEQFSRDFQKLEIVHKEAHTPFRYLLSGGVSMRQLVPSFSHSFFKSIEHVLRPFNNTIGCFCTIVIKKLK